MPISKRPFSNPKLRVVPSFNNVGEPQILESLAILPNRNARRKALHDGDVSEHYEATEPGIDATTELKKGKDYISKLADFLAPRTPPKGTKAEDGDAMRLAHERMKEGLYLLSPYELSKMSEQLNNGPRSEKEVYKKRYTDYVQQNLRDHQINYPHSTVKPFVTGEKEPKKSRSGKATGEYKEVKESEHLSRNLHPMRFSKVGPLEIGGETVFRDYVEAYHQDFGKILLCRLYDPKTKQPLSWQAFDGFTEDTATRTIAFDDTRSTLLLENGLLAPVQEAIDHLQNLGETDIDGMRMDAGNAHREASVETFNRGTVGKSKNTRYAPVSYGRGIVPHIDSIPTQEQRGLIDNLFKGLASIADTKSKTSNISDIQALLGDPIVLYSMLNDLKNFDPTQESLLGDYKKHKAQNFMGIGSPDQHGDNKDALYEALNNRNARYETTEDNKKLAMDRGEEHPVTNYSTPLKPNGLPVRHEEMTKDEKALERKHYGDLYDRPASYLQHSEEGLALYKTYRGKSAATLADMQEGSKRDKLNEYVEWKPLLLDGKYEYVLTDLLDEGGGFAAKEDSLLYDLPIRDIFNDTERYIDLLSQEQQSFLDVVAQSDEAKYILGIDVDEDQLAHDMTIDTLLGRKWYPTQDEWRYYDSVGVMEQYHINDTFKLRLGGILELTAPDEDGNYGLVLQDEDYGLSDPERFVDLDLPQEIADSKSTQYAGNLNNLFRPSVKDQFVRNGILPSDYASSGDVKKIPGAPEPPEHGSPECMERVAFIHALVSEYPQNEEVPFLFRGFDNSPISFEYDIDPENPDAIRIANDYNEESDPELRDAEGNIYKVILKQLNSRYGGEGADIFYYGDKASIPEDVVDMKPSPPVEHNGRVITVVTMPDGSRQPFYRRTGDGNRDVESDTEPGIWMPFNGITERAGSEWMIKPSEFEKGYEQDTKMARYGNAANHAMSQRLGVAFEENMLFPDQSGKGGGAVTIGEDGRGTVHPRLSTAQQMMAYGSIGSTTELEGAEKLISLNKYLADVGYAEASEILEKDFEVKDYAGGDIVPPRDTSTGGGSGDDSEDDSEEEPYEYGNMSYTQVADALEADPNVRAYRKQLRDKHDSEILQNAPINVRATAWRQRLAGIEDRMKSLKTQGDAHNLTRELMRAAIVEHPDMMRIDRDGASIFRRLSRQLVAGGADLYAIDKELQDHRNTVNDMDNTISGIEEYKQALKASGLVPDRRKTPPDEWTDEQKEAHDRLNTLQNELHRLTDKKIRYTYGSDEHIEKLYDPQFGLAEVYDKMNNTDLTGDAQQQLNNYSRLKDGRNVVASALRVGMEAYSESTLLGNSKVASMLQAVMATIGEGTGFGGDKIRNLDVTKPLDQHQSEAGGWASWLKLPIPERIGSFEFGSKVPDALKHETSEAWRRKQAGAQGEGYTPDPKAEDPEYAGPLDRTQGKITVEPPKYKQDTEAPQPEEPTQSTTSDDTEASQPTSNPTPETPKMTREDLENDPAVKAYREKLEKPKTYNPSDTSSEDPFGD